MRVAVIAALMVGAIGVAATCAATAHAEDDDAVAVPYKDTPQMVRDIAPCDIDANVTRRPFAGGVVFAFACPGNNANFIQALVYAPRENGEGARVLDFAVPGRRNPPKEELSNIRWSRKDNEVSEIFVDPENKAACRTEARWKIPNGGTKPRLVFWRETRDCDGNGGWKVVVGKK